MTCEISLCSVEALPSEVDAGADLILKGKVACSPATDLRGEALRIMDQEGALVGSIELGAFDGETNETGELVVKAPVEPGAYTWLAVCQPRAAEGTSREETTAPFSFTVKAHTTRVVVWDAPPAVEPGEKFSVKVGVKCSSECRPGGWMVGVHDQDGTERAAATISGEPWPDTDALYYTSVDLSAPDTEGLHTWEAKAPMRGLDIPHAECNASFGVRVVPTPECLLTVVAVDAGSRMPVEGAKVVVHPYRTFTDERGVAEVRVPKGEYRLFVSGKRYFPFRMDGEAETDVTIRAELALDRELSDADIWS